MRLPSWCEPDYVEKWALVAFMLFLWVVSVRVKKGCWLTSLCLQVTKRVGSRSPVQALQQTPRVCSDETSTWVSSQTRYVSTYLWVPATLLGLQVEDHKITFFLRFVSCLADIPVFPTITATVTFQEFRYDKFEESIFYIPAEYKEDPSRFPDLWSVNTSDTNRKRLAGLGERRLILNTLVVQEENIKGG